VRSATVALECSILAGATQKLPRGCNMNDHGKPSRHLSLYIGLCTMVSAKLRAQLQKHNPLQSL